MLRRVVGPMVVAGFLAMSVSSRVAAEEPWRLTLFLTPQCPHNEDAIGSVIAFLRRHPEIDGSAVLIAALDEIHEALPHLPPLFSQGVAVAVDETAGDTHGITETPLVVLQKGEQKLCSTGRLDLQWVWEHIHEDIP